MFTARPRASIVQITTLLVLSIRQKNPRCVDRARTRLGYKNCSNIKAIISISQRRLPMVSIPKIVGVLSCGFLLCLGLSHTAQAEHPPAPSDVMKTDSQTDRQGYQSDDDKEMNDKMGSNRAKGAKTIKGELFRVEDGTYFVKVKGGKEVR
jgi:hypothetical protein